MKILALLLVMASDVIAQYDGGRMRLFNNGYELEYCTIEFYNGDSDSFYLRPQQGSRWFVDENVDYWGCFE